VTWLFILRVTETSGFLRRWLYWAALTSTHS